MEDHLQSAMRLHLDLACVKLNNTQVQLSNTQKELKETTRKLEEKLKDTRNKLQEKLKETTRKLEENFKETTSQLEKKINVLENTRMQNSEENIYHWKINSFSEVLSRAKSGKTPVIESVPFYRYGYKFKLSLNPNGCGDGENTHLSIFIIIMKGEYDAILPWPLHKKITLTLIDQKENPNDRENIVEYFTTKPELRRFARPVTVEKAV